MTKTPWNKTRIIFSPEIDDEYICEKCRSILLLTNINYCPYCGLEVEKGKDNGKRNDQP